MFRQVIFHGHIFVFKQRSHVEHFCELLNIYIVRNDDVKGLSFRYHGERGSVKVVENKTFDEVAFEAIEWCFIKETSNKFIKANAPTITKLVSIEGNWITAEELKAYKNKCTLQVVSDAVDDSRDNRMFVIGYPILAKHRAVVPVRSVRKTRWASSALIRLPSGFEPFEYRIWRPHQYVLGDVVCPLCRHFGTVQSLHMRFINGIGPRCGPCTDHLVESGKTDDSSFDPWEEET